MENEVNAERKEEIYTLALRAPFRWGEQGASTRIPLQEE